MLLCLLLGIVRGLLVYWLWLIFVSLRLADWFVLVEYVCFIVCVLIWAVLFAGLVVFCM